MLKTFFNPDRPVSINGVGLILTLMFMHLVGPQAVILQPAFVDGMVGQLGFDPVQAGYVAASENTGKAVQSLLMMILVTRVNWRYLFYGALAVLIAGNLICTVVDDYQTFRVVRFFTGVANGTIVPLCYVVVGLTAAADRNFGLLMVSLMTYAAVIFFAIPTIFAMAGLVGLLLVFAAFASLAIPLVRNVPTHGEQPSGANEGVLTLSWGFRGMALGAMFFYFVATFAVWTYMSLIGRDTGIPEQQVANALTLSQFAGIAGAGIAVLLGSRFGRAWPLAISLVGSMVSLVILGSYRTAMGFAVAACIFQLLWNTTHPYLLGAHASFDRSGRQVTYAVAMQMMGIAAGPAIAAWILTLPGGGYARIIALSTALLAITTLLIQPPVLRESSLSGKRKLAAAPSH